MYAQCNLLISLVLLYWFWLFVFEPSIPFSRVKRWRDGVFLSVLRRSSVQHWPEAYESFLSGTLTEPYQVWDINMVLYSLSTAKKIQASPTCSGRHRCHREGRQQVPSVYLWAICAKRSSENTSDPSSALQSEYKLLPSRQMVQNT